MAVSSRLIKRRIRSVANTRKITKAMELVAASKMRKSVQMTLASRAYSGTAADIVARIRTLVDPASHPLLAARPVAIASLVIVAASDRGLCGGFNAQLLKKTLEFLRSRNEKDLRVVTVGKRAEAAVKRAGYPVVAAFEAISNAPSYERARPVGELAYKEFTAGTIDRVFLVYTDFKSAISYTPIVAQLLPIIPENELPAVDEYDVGAHAMRQDPDEPDGRRVAHAPTDEQDTLFEPNAKEVLDTLLPRLIDTRVYQALLESSASEHSARMLAMRSATDNASEMLDDLTFTFNQARQAAITREISEISAGKAALE